MDISTNMDSLMCDGGTMKISMLERCEDFSMISSTKHLQSRAPVILVCYCIVSLFVCVLFC